MSKDDFGIIRPKLPPEVKEWIDRRVGAVREAYGAFDALVEHGVDTVPDNTTPTQIFCPFHDNKNTAAARYYPKSGRHHDYVRCYRCKESWDGIRMFARFKGLKFMEALRDLERRFGIKIPKRPDSPEFKDSPDRDSTYVSDAWTDVPRVLDLLETKMNRMKSKLALLDFVKFCRLLDAVRWDADHGGEPTAMILALHKVRDMMNDFAFQDVDLEEVQSIPELDELTIDDAY